MKRKLKAKVKSHTGQEHPLYKDIKTNSKTVSVRRSVLAAFAAIGAFLMLGAGVLIGKASVPKSPYSDYELYAEWQKSYEAGMQTTTQTTWRPSPESTAQTFTTTSVSQTKQPTKASSASEIKTTSSSEPSNTYSTTQTTRASTTTASTASASTTLPPATTSAGSTTAAPSTDVINDASTVWVSSKGGTKYHTKPDCSGMSSPNSMTLADAISKGFTACKNCD